MKKEDLPQDHSPLDKMTRELCYVKDEEGKYITGLSKGWEVKTSALNKAWEDINERIADAKNAVKENKKSPIYYYMELLLMDFTVLSGYTGFWKLTIKRHLKPEVFHSLNSKTLATYAKAFNVSVDELKNFRGY